MGFSGNLGGTAGMPVPIGTGMLIFFQEVEKRMKKLLLGLIRLALGTAWALARLLAIVWAVEFVAAFCKRRESI